MKERCSTSTNPSLCSCCNTPTHLYYYQGERVYCYNCALNLGVITKNQWRGDSAEHSLITQINKRK